MGKDAVAIPDEFQPLLAQMASQLTHQAFPAGMPWGTKFDYLEALAGALGDEIARQMIEASVGEQGTTVPEAMETCPTCGNQGRQAPDKPRELITTRGTVAWTEPGQRCPHCRRAFFPSEPIAGTGSNGR